MLKYVAAQKCPDSVYRYKAELLETLWLLPARRSNRGTYSNVPGWLAGWVAGCLYITRRYCIKTATHISTHFRPPGSSIILVSRYPFADT